MRRRKESVGLFSYFCVQRRLKGPEKIAKYALEHAEVHRRPAEHREKQWFPLFTA